MIFKDNPVYQHAISSKYVTCEYACLLINKNLKHVLEFGVYQCTSIRKIRNILDDSFQVFGFDSFEGLPEDWEGTICKKGFFNKNGEVPVIEGIKFYAGWFDDTIHEYIKIAEPIGLLHVDCDLYSSTVTVLENLRPYIVKDTIIVFDEWLYTKEDGRKGNLHEQRAFLEWVKKYDIRYECELYEDYDHDERMIVRIL
jgi:hypothetical protein